MLSSTSRRLTALLGGGNWASVFTAREHGVAVTRARSAFIGKRARLLGFLFAFLTVAWIAIDAATFDRKVWLPLALGRIVAALAFIAIAVHEHRPFDPRTNFIWLSALFAVPACFFVYSQAIYLSAPAFTMPVMMSAAYGHLPYIVMTALAIFPLTLRENATLGVLLLVLFGAGMATGLYNGDPLANFFGSRGPQVLSMLWPLMLVTGVAAIAGMSQLQILVAAIEQSSRDGLTGLYTRRLGEQILEFQLEVAKRSDTALSAIFVDLDDFKGVNDLYGHECGDKVLYAAAQALASTSRKQDVLVRWGGEEFLILMPNTSIEESLVLVARLAKAGLGHRPDGTPQTASLGLAERSRDSAPTWLKLVDTADGRMYAAKAAGKNRIVGVDDVARLFITEVALDGGDRPQISDAGQARVRFG